MHYGIIISTVSHPLQTAIGPIFLFFPFMEKTLSIYVESINETWELSDELVIKLQDYKTGNPITDDNSNADEVHKEWFATLSAEDRQKVARHKPEEEAG